MQGSGLLNIENLSVEFSTDEGIVRAVEGISLSLDKGQTLGIVGESGSGKSVTALAVMRLLSSQTARITSGHIWFDHPRKGRIDLLSVDEQEMQHIRGNHISMIFQEPMTSLNPVKRCGKQVMESLVWHRQASPSQARQKVLDLFSEVKLPSPEKAFKAWPHELSGGQRQRVMIAMAMACNPSLLIADEPTTALDVTVQKSIIELMKSLQQDHNMGIIFISHDLGVIGQIASRASVMLEGKVVESDAIRNLFTTPKHPYTRALLACRPGLMGRTEKLSVVSDFMEDSPAAEPQKEVLKTEKEKEHPILERRKKNHQRIYSQKPILEISGLKTFFVTKRTFFGKPVGHYKAVDNVSFSVYKGETLGLVGESGCGKTTLGRSLMRLIEPSEGEIIYKGTNLASLSDSALRQLRPKFQIIFQDPYSSLTPGMMVGKAIMEPMRLHNILSGDHQRKEKVMELLEKVNLEEKHFYRYPHEFSGGQRQRICIARALALQPEFIICDESVSALDVSVQAQVLNLLNQMKQEFDLTYIFISHDLSVVKYMADRIMVMKNGQMIETGEADELYARPANAYTWKLISSVPSPEF